MTNVPAGTWAMRLSSTMTQWRRGIVRRAGSYGDAGELDRLEDRLGVLRLVLCQHRVHEAVA